MAHAPVPVLVMMMFSFSFQHIAVMAQTETCKSVESTSDRCRSADYITVNGQRVNKGDSNKIIQLAVLQTEVRWFCGSSQERTAWSTPANQLQISYQSDGTIQWDIKKCAPTTTTPAPACESVESTSDKCRSADHITVNGQRVNKGDSNKIIQLAGLQTEERTAWSTPANQLQISYQSDGTIQWDVCAPTPTPAPACESVESTSDKCRSADHITVNGQRVNKGDSNKIIQLAGLQTEVRWFCGSSQERTAWSTPANQLKITYEGDGTIQWNIYKCVQSAGNFVRVGPADLVMICLIAIVANMYF
ncbi:hypothetical protein OS493_005732 [Desmophyllum pertusum]|uniref:Uncharacterized protein n=1 Tax=Desmophyllum pertusum TaxID=174260 RepID=A0A9X0CI78_9CNID|nr:hypothetical protein OS493_005732 [Desmophyllum pertusum]